MLYVIMPSFHSNNIACSLIGSCDGADRALIVIAMFCLLLFFFVQFG